MGFDFQAFFKQQNIPFITKGKNVAAGHINIKCPFCGQQDPSQHMGVELSTSRWGCYRNALHRGKKPHRLIMALKFCSWDEAEKLAQSGYVVESVGYDALKERAGDLFSKHKEQAVKFEELEFWSEFKRIQRGGLRGKFFDYLVHRGFAKADVENLIEQYKLRCCLAGRFAHRLILPFYFWGDLVGWTGRAITKAETRYLSYPNSSVVKSLVFNHDKALSGGRVLIIVEGPLDCLKVDYYMRRDGIRAVGLLGVATTQIQICLLQKLAERFDDVMLLLDDDALSQALQLSSSLAVAKPKVAQLPEGIHDPGELRYDEVSDVITGLEEKYFA